MQLLHLHEIAGWDRIRRANFVNTLSGYKSASLIGTVDREGRHNLSLISNIVHLGADPALIGYINRPRAATPHTLQNIESTGVYTINHIHPSFAMAAHQTSAKYPEGISEFETCSLTPEFLTGCSAPFVKESNVGYALQLEEVIPIKQNGTFLVIGQLLFARFPEQVLREDGFLALEEAGSLASLGLDAYYRCEQIARLPYARPGSDNMKKS